MKLIKPMNFSFSSARSAMPGTTARLQKLGLAFGLVTALSGCATSFNQAPVSDKNIPRGGATTTTAPATQPTTASPGTMPGASVGATTTAPGAGAGQFADKAGQPGFYVVKPGDTVMHVALQTGQYWRDIARWNGMDNPNVLQVGQVLRVAPLLDEPQTKPIAAPTRVEGRPLTAASAPVTGASVPAGVVTTPASTPIATAPNVPSAPSAPSAPAAPSSNGEGNDEDVAWAWPASGAVTAGFDSVRNKGIDINGKQGDPVFAAADGRVVLASVLRGYGNLVVVRHNNAYISAYAHNSKILVKEGDAVKRNQRIAEMGNSDSDKVKLHFEIRRQGLPIDPMKWLPSK
jgi:lipoprotein NlpD